MSRLDLYSHAIARCLVNAERTWDEEIRRMWITLADNYRYLVDLERSPLDGGCLIAPAARRNTSFLAGQQSLVLGGDEPIAVAGGRLEALAIDNSDGAAAVFDQSRLLQDAGGYGDSGSVHAKHLRQEFLRQGK